MELRRKERVTCRRQKQTLDAVDRANRCRDDARFISGEAEDVRARQQASGRHGPIFHHRPMFAFQQASTVRDGVGFHRPAWRRNYPREAWLGTVASEQFRRPVGDIAHAICAARHRRPAGGRRAICAPELDGDGLLRLDADDDGAITPSCCVGMRDLLPFYELSVAFEGHKLHRSNGLPSRPPARESIEAARPMRRTSRPVTRWMHPRPLEPSWRFPGMALLASRLPRSPCFCSPGIACCTMAPTGEVKLPRHIRQLHRHSDRFRFISRVLGNTVLLGVAVTVICACLAYPLAYFLVRLAFPLARFADVPDGHAVDGQQCDPQHRLDPDPGRQWRGERGPARHAG